MQVCVCVNVNVIKAGIHLCETCACVVFVYLSAQMCVTKSECVRPLRARLAQAHNVSYSAGSLD